MANHLRLALGGISLLILAAGVSPAHGAPGKEIYDKQCASCHTIGGGDTGGPDLKGVTAKRPDEWLVRVIVEPEKLTAEKDPTQAQLVKQYGYEMPALGISREDALQVLAYLKEAAPAAGGALPAQPPAASSSNQPIVATKELVDRGRRLFIGQEHFSKGGAPCIACHAFRYPGIHGGNFGADLTGLYEGMGEQGMRGVLKSLRFPAMTKIYANRPLQDDETTALIAFAKDAAARKEPQTAGIFPASGVGIFVASLVMFIIYKRRIR